MSKPLKIIVSVFLSFAILFNILPVFSFAEDYSSDKGINTNIWERLFHMLVDGLELNQIPVIGGFANYMFTTYCEDTCPLSEDHWHHADDNYKLFSVREHEEELNADGTYSFTGRYKLVCDCMYCGKRFDTRYFSPEEVSETYSDYVDTLPAQGYDSAGTLLWQPRWTDAVSCTINFLKGRSGTNYKKISDLPYSISDFARCETRGPYIYFSFSYQSPAYYYCDVTSANFSAPISGYYRQMETVAWSCSVLTNTSTSLPDNNYAHEYYWPGKDLGSVSSGNVVFASFDISKPSYGYSIGNLRGGNVLVQTPVYSIVPSNQPVITINYTTNSRANTFNGDFYEGTTNTYYENCTVINETTNIYHDPSTGTDHTMQNWSYDYRSRTYFITLEDGTTVTVQFGDDCLTITNNNATNSYQYVIKNSGSTPEQPSGCKHDWKETVDKAPTCLEGGHASFTCPKCNETYEQLLAAKGHNWTVKEHINTVYDEDGTLVTQGHTLYECSVCGEQWYTDSAAPPPDTSGSSSVLSWLQSFKTWLEEKLDLTPLLDRLDSILESLQAIPGSTACEHNYEQHTEQEADCTLPGLIIFTCPECGESYSEVVDPLGHDWIISDHVDAVTDPETGEVTASAYDIYTCSRCSRTYEDHTAGGAPSEDYNDSLISQLVVNVFSKLGTFAGKLIGFVVNLFSKAISSVDELITRFNAYVEQIGSFGGGYPTWLSGFWLVLPTELQVALTFGFLCIVLGMVGKKLFFS